MRNFCTGDLQAQKDCPRMQYFYWGACYQLTAQMVQLWVTESILWASRHPRDVTFCMLVLMGDVWFE